MERIEIGRLTAAVPPPANLQCLDQPHEARIVCPQPTVRESCMVARPARFRQRCEWQEDRRSARGETHVHNLVMTVDTEPQIVRRFENLRCLIEHLRARDAKRDAVFLPDIAQRLVAEDGFERGLYERLDRVRSAASALRPIHPPRPL